MEKMEQLMMKVWGLEKPNLLISVTGGANYFNMKAKLKEAFRRGLMQVARSTGICLYVKYTYILYTKCDGLTCFRSSGLDEMYHHNSHSDE